jgi:uracil-DNA glycosylase family 4
MIAPGLDCHLCARLAEYRQDNKKHIPDGFNAPVPTFYGTRPRVLIVGLAPGLNGANRTGRPFTGDYAGDLLYAALLRFGFARGLYKAKPDDSLELIDCSITNAVRCVPPKNKPVAAEINACRPFLKAEIENQNSIQAILALGRISHESVVRAFSRKLSEFRFSHGARHDLSPKITLFDSYHCSRYNTNTRRLSTEMFMEIFSQIRSFLDG